MEKITLKSDLCDGSLDCEHICAGLYGTSRISIKEVDSKHYHILCQQCETAPCVLICPTDAMKRDKINSDDCIGCGLCVMVCPFGAVHMYDRKASKCDRCKGIDEEPGCIRSCSKRALELVDTDMLTAQKQEKYLNKVAEMEKRPKTSFIDVIRTVTKSNELLNKK
ncbi:MAG: 4Fe-4S dicluster domain-containing protein [Methanobrevibacter sp.]|nr:4Fe-4S dicluster domain-containing protein [Candidatus Methanovirga basalitermitum]